MRSLLPAALVLTTASSAVAQGLVIPPEPQREFRGVWVATVDNIDWPSEPGLPADRQKAELDAILDRAAEMNLNAVVLQVRPTADALYDSKLEPWSEWLSGSQGKPPRPRWDPLEHAVEGAHRRGMELHAWFNPYRVRHPKSESRPAVDNVARQFPDMVVAYGDYLWMDPGHPRSREWSLAVIRDVVRRYDVDGVHLDDYFYPYPIGREDFPDDRSFRDYRRRGGDLSRDDWRRRNVDEFIDGMYRHVKEDKPWVKVGISPFGIARPGVPEGIKAGIDQYAQLYADVQKWLREGWCDYLAPQLYWPIAQEPQSFAKLLPWWAKGADNPTGRHIWPGINPGRQAAMSKNWKEGELLEQIAMIRAQDGATGHIHFSMRVFTHNRAGLVDALTAGPYAQPALVPASPWLGDEPPKTPALEFVPASGTVSWETGDDARFVVLQEYRDGTWHTLDIRSAGPGRHTLREHGGTRTLAVTAVSRTGIASKPAVASR